VQNHKHKTNKKKGKGAKNPSLDPFVNPTAGPAASGVRVGFPANRTVNLNYCENGSLVSTTGVTAMRQFRINSAYDPDITYTGHQPMGYDQWSLFYNHYVVESIDYEIAVSSSNSGSHIIGIHLSDDVTVPYLVPSELMELGDPTALYTGAITPHIFRGHVDMAKFFNRKDIAADDQLRAAVTGNPTEQAVLSVWAVNADLASTATYYLIIKLSMKIRFMEAKDLTPSILPLKPVKGLPSGSIPAGLTMPVQDDDYEYVRVRKPPTVLMPM
jgi:hypothetical protein